MSLKHKRSIMWFRRDLRLHDHVPLMKATTESEQVLCVFVIDELILRDLKKDNRQVEFISQSLDELDEKLREQGSRLLVVHGNPVEQIPLIVKKFKAEAVYVGRDYEPYAKKREDQVEKTLASFGVEFHVFKDQVIFDGREILNGSNEPYRVFTPYSKNWIRTLELKKAELLKVAKPNLKSLIKAHEIKGENASFSDLKFKKVPLFVPAGEAAGVKMLRAFSAGVKKYDQTRDFPAILGTSGLSVHFRFGTISPREAVQFCYDQFSSGAKVWLNELIWREFYQMILDQFPHVVGHAFKKEYDKLKWSQNKEHFQAWCEGQTGYPIVDAAMRQLNTTGFMHNRLRMVTAMFLTKDLLIDWRLGEAYFAEQLLDHELAANNGGWQWSASTGCDAQPYFRVMNPISQSEKFDSKGEFIKKFVPELKHLDEKRIHWPHEEGGLFSSGLNGYPDPIVEHKAQRLKAIAMFK